MAFVNGFMTQGDTNSQSKATANFVNLDEGQGRNSNDQKQVPPPHHYRLFQTFVEDDNDSRGSQDSDTASFRAHMNKPSPTEIRQWMADTQETVGQVVTSWQQEIIDKSSNISNLLDILVQSVVGLEESGISPPIFSAKCMSNHGTIESVVNVYLHLILVSLRQAVLSKGQKVPVQLPPHSQEDYRKKKNVSVREKKLLIEILRQFSLVAEYALKFLKTHRKILAPVCGKVLEMRNNLFYFLSEIVEEPLQDQIIPIVGDVSLEEIRRAEDTRWLQKNLEEYKTQEMKIPCFLHVQLNAKSCCIVVEHDNEEEEEVDMTVDERLELILILLKKLELSIGSSNKACNATRDEFLEINTKLMAKFQRFQRTMILEQRQDKLNPESCSKNMKESLCQLEVRFHQVEKNLEEIPQHLRRVIGVADQCSRQLIHGFGLEEQFQLEESSSWTSPIEELSEEYFKLKKSYLPDFIPFLWKILAKVFFGGHLSGASKKFNEFWAEVKTDMEDFEKEIKIKELEIGYGVRMKIPLSISVDALRDRYHELDTESYQPMALARYKQSYRSSSSPQKFEFQEIKPLRDNGTSSPPGSEIYLHQRQLSGNVQLLEEHHRAAVIVKEFKYMSEDCKVDRKLDLAFIDDASPEPCSNCNRCNDTPSFSDNCCTDKMAIIQTAQANADKLNKKLDTYLVRTQNK